MIRTSPSLILFAMVGLCLGAGWGCDDDGAGYCEDMGEIDAFF